MTIEEVKVKKKELEKSLLELVQRFEKETKTKTTDIHIHTVENEQGSSLVISLNVKVEL